VLSDLVGDPDSISGTVVEVGSGPHGVVRYLFNNAHFKLGMDPLLHKFDEAPSPESRTSYAAAVGEMIPVRDSAADLVVCINVLDHVMDAHEILREIRRVLKPGGKLILEVHTFPGILAPLMFFDGPHTHHWTRAGISRMVHETGYRILATRERRLPAKLSFSSVLRPSGWTYLFGKLFLQLSYIYCQR
jgi:ubiquinone/menaquinone biosynthesis C-methylase UbiE